MSRNAKIIIVSIAVGVAVAGANLGILLGPVAVAAIRGKHVCQHLLCETDHRALLDACRELSAQVADGRLEADTYRVRFRPHSEASQFPEPILALRPYSVALSESGRVRIEMTGKWWSLGVNAYPEGEEKRFPESRFGDHRLLEGLWYYDDQYLHDPDYDRQIDALLKAREKLSEPGTSPRESRH